MSDLLTFQPTIKQHAEIQIPAKLYPLYQHILVINVLQSLKHIIKRVMYSNVKLKSNIISQHYYLPHHP